jgi:hypothetical protein
MRACSGSARLVVEVEYHAEGALGQAAGQGAQDEVVLALLPGTPGGRRLDLGVRSASIAVSPMAGRAFST